MTLPPMPFGNVIQLCVLTRDLDAAVRCWADRYGVGPWTIYDFTPETTTKLEVHGKPVAYGMRVALAPWGPIRLEIIEPLDDRSIYEESLRRHGNRDHFHHLQVDGDWDETIGNLAALDVPVSQSGAAGGVEWAYFDTDNELGFAIEITRRAEGFRFPEPSGVYPPS